MDVGTHNIVLGLVLFRTIETSLPNYYYASFFLHFDTYKLTEPDAFIATQNVLQNSYQHKARKSRLEEGVQQNSNDGTHEKPSCLTRASPFKTMRYRDQKGTHLQIVWSACAKQAGGSIAEPHSQTSLFVR